MFSLLWHPMAGKWGKVLDLTGQGKENVLPGCEYEKDAGGYKNTCLS